MRDPTVNSPIITAEGAEEEAYRRLRLGLVKIISWADPPGNPQEECHFAVKFVDAVLNDLIDSLPESAENDNVRDSFLRANTPLVRDFAIPALRRLRPGKQRGCGRPKLLLQRDRVIAETVDYICEKCNLNPTPTESKNKKECGCSIVGKALKRWGIKLSTKSIVGIWQRARKSCP